MCTIVKKNYDPMGSYKKSIQGLLIKIPFVDRGSGIPGSLGGINKQEKIQIPGNRGSYFTKSWLQQKENDQIFSLCYRWIESAHDQGKKTYALPEVCASQPVLQITNLTKHDMPERETVF